MYNTAEITWLNPSSCFYVGLYPAARRLGDSYRINKWPLLYTDRQLSQGQQVVKVIVPRYIFVPTPILYLGSIVVLTKYALTTGIIFSRPMLIYPR